MLQTATKTANDEKSDQIEPERTGTADFGSKEREPQSLAQAKEASLESAAKEAEELKAELKKQGLETPHHEEHLTSDDLTNIGAFSPLKEAEEIVDKQTVTLPIDKFELEKKSSSLDDSFSWMKEKFLWIMRHATHLGKRIIFREKPQD